GSTPSAGSAMRNAATVAPSTTTAARRSIFMRQLSARARPIQGFGIANPGAQAHRAVQLAGGRHERLLKPLLTLCHLSASSIGRIFTGLIFAKAGQVGIGSGATPLPQSTTDG